MHDIITVKIRLVVPRLLFTNLKDKHANLIKRVLSAAFGWRRT